jgi:hypothetical protein
MIVQSERKGFIRLNIYYLFKHAKSTFHHLSVAQNPPQGLHSFGDSLRMSWLWFLDCCPIIVMFYRSSIKSSVA